MQDTIDVTVRRSPRYSAFIVVGVIIGFIVAGILSVLPIDVEALPSTYTRTSALGLLMAILGLVGAGLGAAVAIIVDRVSLKKAKTVTVAAEYEAAEAGSSAVAGSPAEGVEEGSGGRGTAVDASESSESDSDGSGADPRNP